MTEEPAKLDDRQIAAVLTRPNGFYALMELVRMGRVDSRDAERALDRYDRKPLGSRILAALVDVLFHG